MRYLLFFYVIFKHDVTRTASLRKRKGWHLAAWYVNETAAVLFLPTNLGLFWGDLPPSPQMGSIQIFKFANALLYNEAIIIETCVCTSICTCIVKNQAINNKKQIISNQSINQFNIWGFGGKEGS